MGPPCALVAMEAESEGMSTGVEVSGLMDGRDMLSRCDCGSGSACGVAGGRLQCRSRLVECVSSESRVGCRRKRRP